jgi:hypothetical protein
MAGKIWRRMWFTRAGTEEVDGAVGVSALAEWRHWSDLCGMRLCGRARNVCSGCWRLEAKRWIRDCRWPQGWAEFAKPNAGGAAVHRPTGSLLAAEGLGARPTTPHPTDRRFTFISWTGAGGGRMSGKDFLTPVKFDGLEGSLIWWRRGGGGSGYGCEAAWGDYLDSAGVRG